jgi:hypothetical protein
VTPQAEKRRPFDPVDPGSFEGWFINAWFRNLIRLVTWWKRW